MEMNYGYRLLRGRNGATGHVRAQKDGQFITLRGLEPGAVCAVYGFAQGEAAPRAQGQVDREGGARFFLPEDGKIFAVVGEKVALWEEEGNAEENYFRACQSLTKLSLGRKDEAEHRPPPALVSASEEDPKGIVPQEKAEITPEEASFPLSLLSEAGRPAQPRVPPAEAGDEEKTPAPPEALLEIQVASFQPPAAMAQPVSSSAPPLRPERLEEYFLRPAGEGAPTDELPALVWPPAAAELRVYFETLTPIAPFDAPGWRFVRVPSPLRGVPYCAVGYHAQDCRVTQVVYAVPGTPHRAPAALPGYRYQVGRGGEGYWTLWRRVEA